MSPEPLRHLTRTAAKVAPSQHRPMANRGLHDAADIGRCLAVAADFFDQAT